MENGFDDLLGDVDVDDVLLDFAASSVDPDDPLLGLPGSGNNGVIPFPLTSATWTDDLHRPAPPLDGTPSPSSTPAPDAAADSRARRKAEQNKCADLLVSCSRGTEAAGDVNAGCVQTKLRYQRNCMRFQSGLLRLPAVAPLSVTGAALDIMIL